MGKILNIYNQIKKDINHGIYIDKLPSEKSLCTKYECSRSSLRFVINKLQDVGLINSQHGKGHFISKNFTNNLIKSFSDKQKHMQGFENEIEDVKYYEKCINDYNLRKVIMYHKKRKLNNAIIEESHVILNAWLIKKFDLEKAKLSIIEFLEEDQNIKLSYEKSFIKCVKNNNKVIKTSANFLIFSRSIYFNELDEIVCIIEYFLAPEYFKSENIYYGK